MKIFGLNIFRAKQKSLSAASWLRADEGEGGCTAFRHAYQQVVWVYRAINVLAEQVANVPFLFSTGPRGRENLITHGPLLDFYARPHPHINQFQYWELRIIWLMLRGECFRIPIFSDAASSASSRRRLERVLILDPAHFQHLVHNHQLVGWRYTGFGPQTPLANQVLLPEEVWFEKLPDPFDFWRGLAPLEAAANAARTDFAAAAFMRGLIENNADAGLIVRTERPLGPEQEQQLLACLRERKRRAGVADRPMLLSGAAEVIRPQLSSSDLQFLENRKFSRAEICAAFGVPEEILTATDHAKYDVMRGARQNFIENRVAPLCRRLEAEEERTVKAIDSEASGWFDLDSLPIMQQARQGRLDSARTGFEMGIPFNELNRVLDLGFHPLPWGDSGYLPAKLQKVGSARSVEPSPQAPGAIATLPDLPERANEFLSKTLASARIDSSPCLTREQDAQLQSQIKLMTGKLRRFFFNQRARVLAALRTFENQRALPPEKMTDDLFNITEENKELDSLLRPLFIELFKNHYNVPEEPGLAESAATHSLSALASINQLTGAQLIESLKQGGAANESADQLASRAKAIFEQASDQRAPQIARAEILSAISAPAPITPDVSSTAKPLAP